MMLQTQVKMLAGACSEMRPRHMATVAPTGISWRIVAMMPLRTAGL